PGNAPAGGAGFTLTVNGYGFSRACKVTWNSTVLTTTYVSPTQLTATVTAALIASPGAPSITITIPGVTGASNAMTFGVGNYGLTVPSNVEGGAGITVRGTFRRERAILTGWASTWSEVRATNGPLTSTRTV